MPDTLDPQAPERPLTSWGTGPDPNLQGVDIAGLGTTIYVPKDATPEQIGAIIRKNRDSIVRQAKTEHNTPPIGSIIEQRAQELGIRPVQQNNNAAVSASSFGLAPVGPPRVGLQGGLAVAPALQQSVTNETNRRFQGQRMRQGLASPDSPQDYDVSQQMHQMAIMGIPAPPNVNQVAGAAVAGRPFDINAPSFSQALLDRYTNTPGAGQAGATLPGFPAGMARGLGGFMEPTSLETMAILGPLGSIPQFSQPLLAGYEGLQGYNAVQNARQVQIDPETGQRYHDVAGAIGELTAGQLPIAAGIWGARESAMNRLPQEEYMRGYNWQPPMEEPPVAPQGLGPGPRPQPGQPQPGTPPPEGQGVRFSERFNTSHGKSAPEAPRGPVVTTEPLQPGDVITSRFGGRLVVHADDGGPTIRVSMNEQSPMNVPRSALFGSPVESGGPAPTTATAQPTTTSAPRASQVQPTQTPVPSMDTTTAPPAPVNIPTATGFTFAPPAQTPSAPVVERPAPAPAPPSVSPEVAAWQQTLSTPRAQTQAKIQHELAAVNLVKQGVPLPPQAQADYPHLAGLRPENFGKNVPSELSKAYAEALTNRDRFPDEPEFQRRLDAAGQAIVAHQNGQGQAAPSAPQQSAAPSQSLAPHRPLYEMSPEELDAYHRLVKDDEKQSVIDVFGEEGAKRYNAAQRVANSATAERSRQKEADALIDQMEGVLTQAQRQRLFGEGQAHLPNADDVRAYSRALGSLDYSSPQAMGESLRYAITNVGTETDPAKMSPSEQVAYATMRHAFEQARAMGWDMQQVSDSAVRSAAQRFDTKAPPGQPSDAEVMLGRYRKPAEKPVQQIQQNQQNALPAARLGSPVRSNLGNTNIPNDTFPIHDKTGKQIAEVQITKLGELASIHWLGEPGGPPAESPPFSPLSNSIGANGLREILRQYVEQNPEITHVGGFRTGGSRHDKPGDVVIPIEKILGKSTPAPARAPIPKPAAKPKGKVTPQQAAANETGVHVGEKGGKTPASQKVKSSGFTSSQEQFLGNALRDALPNLPQQTTLTNRQVGRIDGSTPGSTDQWAADYSQGVKIDVPGDGRFEVASQQQAKELLKLIGQDAEVKVTDPLSALTREFGKASITPHGHGFKSGEYNGEPAVTNSRLLLLNEPALTEAAKALPEPREANVPRVIPQGKDLEGYHPTRPVVKVKSGSDDLVRFDFHDEAGNPLYILKKYVDAIYKRGYTLEAKTRLKPLIAKDASGNIRGIVMPYNGESIVAEEELPYAMPKGAPKQPAVEAQLTPKGWDGADAGQPKVYVSRKGTQTKTVYVSPDTARMLTGHFGLSNASFGGANVNPNYVPPLLGALDAQAQEGVPGAAELAQNIRAMRDANGSVKFTVTRKNLPEMRRVTIHEDTHRAQINWKQPSFDAMNGNVYFDGAWARLRESGYRISQPGYVREVGARLVAGQYDSLGLDQAEGDELLRHYVKELDKENGHASVADTLRLARGTGRTLRNEYKQQAEANVPESGQAQRTPEGLTRRGREGLAKGDRGDAPDQQLLDAVEYTLIDHAPEPVRQFLDEVRNNALEGLSGLQRYDAVAADAVTQFAATSQIANLFGRVRVPQFEAKFANESNRIRWQLFNVADAIESLRDKLTQDAADLADHANRLRTERRNPGLSPEEKREIENQIAATARRRAEALDHIANLTEVPDPVTGRPITRTALENYFRLPDVQGAGQFYEDELYPILEQARIGANREANGLRGLYGDHFVPKIALDENGDPFGVGSHGAFTGGKKAAIWKMGSVPGDRTFTGKADSYMEDFRAAYTLRLRAGLKAAAYRQMIQQLLNSGAMVPQDQANLTWEHTEQQGLRQERSGYKMDFNGQREPATAFNIQDKFGGKEPGLTYTVEDENGEPIQKPVTDVAMPTRFYNEIQPTMELTSNTAMQQVMQDVASNFVKGVIYGIAEKAYHAASLNSRLGKTIPAFGASPVARALRHTGPLNSLFNLKNIIRRYPDEVRFDAARVAAHSGVLPSEYGARARDVLYGPNGALSNALSAMYQFYGDMDVRAGTGTQNPNGTYNFSSGALTTLGRQMRIMNTHTKVQASRVQHRLSSVKGLIGTFYQTGSRNRHAAFRQTYQFFLSGLVASQLLQVGAAMIADPQHRVPWQQPGWKMGDVMVARDTDAHPVYAPLFSYFDRSQFLSEFWLRVFEESIADHDSPLQMASRMGAETFNTVSEPVFSGPAISAAAQGSGKLPRAVPSRDLKTWEVQNAQTEKYGAGVRAIAAGQALLPLTQVGGPIAEEANPIQNPWLRWGGRIARTAGLPGLRKHENEGDVLDRHRAAEHSNNAPVRRR